MFQVSQTVLEWIKVTAAFWILSSTQLSWTRSVGRKRWQWIWFHTATSDYLDSSSLFGWFRWCHSFSLLVECYSSILSYRAVHFLVYFFLEWNATPSGVHCRICSDDNQLTAQMRLWGMNGERCENDSIWFTGNIIHGQIANTEYFFFKFYILKPPMGGIMTFQP